MKKIQAFHEELKLLLELREAVEEDVLSCGEKPKLNEFFAYRCTSEEQGGSCFYHRRVNKILRQMEKLNE